MIDPNADIALLRDLIDRRTDLNACALRPGQAVHVHALERILAGLQPGGPEYTGRMCYHHDRDTLIADFAALKAFDPGEISELVMRARELAGW